MVATGEFSAGSALLAPLSVKTGMPLDQLNFVFCQLIALALSYPFRVFLHPSKVSPVLRHVIEMGVGLGLAYFCFGYQVIHLLLLSTVSYISMCVLTPRISQRFVLGRFQDQADDLWNQN
jgi:lysophospholipid acyltransferase 1/2